MALFDFLSKKSQRIEERLKKRQQKGAFSPVANQPPAEKKPVAGKKKEKESVKERSSELASRIILSPQITEKTTGLAEKNVYTFRVSARANKVMIKQAIKELYGFEPRKVRIINIHPKTRFIRRRPGVKPGYKKALVYLKEGDKIDIT